MKNFSNVIVYKSMAGKKRSKLCYQLLFLAPSGMWLKGMKYTTLEKVCQELNITLPTARKIMKGESKKYCKKFKIEKI